MEILRIRNTWKVNEEGVKEYKDGNRSDQRNIRMEILRIRKKMRQNKEEGIKEYKDENQSDQRNKECLIIISECMRLSWQVRETCLLIEQHD